MSLSQRLAYLVATWFGLGYARVAPGTVGSVGTLPLYFLLQGISATGYWLTTACLTLAGVAASQKVAEREANEDPSLVVIDEVVGVLLALGIAGAGPFWVTALAFLLFRLLDITKPGPIAKLEHTQPIGVGIMLDDVAAGVLAGVLVLGLRRVLGV
jgi:phosphatidylglycerophosphatase A